jgi:hypothetical protein
VECANGAISALNLLHGEGSTIIAKAGISSSSSTTSYAHASILKAARRFTRRVAARQDRRSDGTPFPTFLPVPSYAGGSDAVPLVAASVSLPSSAGSCEFLNFLPNDLRVLYESPNPSLFVPSSVLSSSSPIRPAFLVESDAEWVALVRRMAAMCMLSFTTTPVVVNGAFGLPKEGDALRFLFDGRPVNAMMTPPPKASMGTPDLLSRLEIPPGERLFVAKEDICNFFHRLRVPLWMRPYFALPPVRAGDVGAEGFDPDTLVWPCCTTLPMGWSHAPGIAQAAHQFIVNNHTSMSVVDQVTATSDFRLDRPRHSLYIDDTGFYALERHLARLRQILVEYRAVMEGLGLPTKLSKRVEPSASGVEVVGVLIEGVSGTCGVDPSKLFALANTTRLLVATGRASGWQVERLVGSWSWAFLCRRAAYCVFSAVYRFLATAQGQVFDIWPSVAKELLLAANLAPLLFSSLRATWSTTVFASDASTLAQGVCSTTCPVDDVREMAASLPPRLVHEQPIDRTLHPLLRGCEWDVLVSDRFRHVEHINVLELRALRSAISLAAASPEDVGSRFLMWVDSLVVMFAFRKGRSSSTRLLAQMRPTAALLLAGDFYVICNWIPTDHNPADAPSRAGPWLDYFDSTLGYPGEGPARFSLLDAAVGVGSASQYRKGCGRFLAYLAEEQLAAEAFSSVRNLDDAFVAFFDDVYLAHGGTRRSWGVNALCGTIHASPCLKGKLPKASRALKAWNRLHPPVPHPPLTWELAVVIAFKMSGTCWAVGVACLLAFVCYLRIGELCRIRASDVAGAGDLRLSSTRRGMSIRLRVTKTGLNKWVDVRNPVVARCIEVLKKGKAPEDFIFGCAPRRFRKVFKESCAALGLSPDYVPHSLRHGGATDDFLRGFTIEQIMVFGRWASSASARHYIQSGRSLLLTMQSPSWLADAARFLVPRVAELFLSGRA